MEYRPAGPRRFAHQRQALRRLIEQRGVAALLMDAGTGKTATVLDYAALLALKSPTGKARVLVIAPLAALDTWVMQSEEYIGPEVGLHAEVLGGSLERRAQTLKARGAGDYTTGLPRRRALYRRPGNPHLTILAMGDSSFSSRQEWRGRKTMADLMVSAVEAYRPDLIVIDESHAIIKTPFSNTSRAIHRLTPLCRRRVILTGTVLPHSPLDAWSQWRFLDPESFATPLADGTVRPMTFSNFRARYAVMGGYMGKEVKGFQRLDEMQETMNRLAFVARKEDVLDLPPTLDSILPVQLSPAEEKAYREMKKSLATRLASGDLASVPNRLTQIMRLRQITSGHLPDDSGGVHQIGQSKARAIESLVRDTLTGERRIVVFAVFRREIDQLAQSLADDESEVLTITGDTPAEKRIEIRKRFGSGDPARLILIAQIKTLSLAVNELVTASHAIFASLSQQRDDLEQARARLDRTGQTRPVTFHYAVVPNTIDTVILNAHRQRSSVEDAVLAHISSLT